MKVILLHDVKNLGKKFEVVEAKEGYANNVLIPQKKAIFADSKSLSKLKNDLKNFEIEKRNKREEAQQLKKILEEVELSYELKYHKGKTQGTITSKMIHDEILQKINIEVDKRKIHIEHISQPGQYIAVINLFENKHANVRIIVKGIE